MFHVLLLIDVERGAASTLQMMQGTVWTGKVWYVYEMKKFEFDLKFDIPVSVRIPFSRPHASLMLRLRCVTRGMKYHGHNLRIEQHLLRAVSSHSP
jgi:hypothetical protein